MAFVRGLSHGCRRLGAELSRRNLLPAGVALVLIAFLAGPARAATLTVDHDHDHAQCPRAQFASIQTAVDNARPGDTVKVCAGTYAEQVTVTTPLTLVGQDATVDPPDSAFTIAFRLAADHV